MKLSSFNFSFWVLCLLYDVFYCMYFMNVSVLYVCCLSIIESYGKDHSTYLCTCVLCVCMLYFSCFIFCVVFLVLYF